MEDLNPKDLQPRTMLGMKLIQQPFSKIPAAENLFDFDALKQTRDTVSHHLQFSNLLMVVQGRKGSGKNSFANSLIVSNHPALYYFNATAETDDTLSNILDKAATNNHADEISVLKKRIHDIMFRGQQPVLIVNDADLLDADVLKEVISYSQGMKDENQQTSLKLLLLGDHSLEKKLETNGILNHNQFYIIDLPQLNVSNTRAFLMHRLNLAGYRDAIPFSDKDITDFYSMANGNPDATLTYAAESLNNNKSLYEDELLSAGRKTKTRLILLGAALFFGAFIYNSLFSPEQKPPQTEIEKIELPPADAVVEKRAVDQLFNRSRLNKPSNNTMDVKQPGQVSSLDNSLSADNALPDLPKEAREQEKPAAVFMDEKTVEITAPQILPARKATPPIKEKPAKTASSGIPAPASEQTETHAQQPEPVPAKPALPKAKVTATEKAPAEPDIKVTTKPVTKPATDKVTNKFINAGTHSPDWLLMQDSSKWSLQILAAYKPETLLAFVDQHRLGSKVAYYRTRLGKQDWHVILYGQYDSKEKARAVIPYLPAYIRQNNPWPKDLKSVQNTIKQYQKQ